VLQRGRAPKSAEITRCGGIKTNIRIASTGPRSEERGDEEEAGEVSQVVGLQRGRAPKSAEIIWRDIVMVASSLASTGPRSEERGDVVGS